MSLSDRFRDLRNFVGANDGSAPRLPENSEFAKFCWYTLVYTLAVVAWGVFLRASNFGDGCGSNWPFCGDNVDPIKGPVATLVESSHRISTMLLGVLCLIIVFWAYKSFEKGHPARKFAGGFLFMTLFEGWIGRYLVKRDLVTVNDTVERAVWMGVHVLSTFLLLGALVGAALSASKIRPITFKKQGAVGWLLGFGFIGTMLLGVSGAIAAFGHQVDPSVVGLADRLKPTAFWAHKLAIAHPIGSVSIGLYLMLMSSLVQHLRQDPFVKNASRALIGILIIQGVVGVANILLKAPVALQMAHLVLAD
ncbi:MAG TPA: COX15/CtaA family protein, partial [Fimbriimonas sp.]|nr:COX15/CtaA family protein [Fimbriimonas sp.]